MQGKEEKTKNLFRQTKISELHLSVGVNEYVGALDVPAQKGEKRHPHALDIGRRPTHLWAEQDPKRRMN